MKKILIALLLALMGCGDGVDGTMDSGTSASLVPVDHIDDLTKQVTYCHFVDMRQCGRFCIPRENSTCCLIPNPDGGEGSSKWYAEKNAPCY